MTRRTFAGGALAAATALQPLAASARQGMPQLRVAGPADGIATLDPARSRDLATQFVVRQLFRGLSRFDDRLEAVPDLAELVDRSPDQTRYTFRLRQGVTFADGRRVSSDDVIGSWTRALTPATAGGFAEALAAVTYLRGLAGAEEVLAGRDAALTGLERVDERTIAVRLVEPDATFLLKLAAVATAVVDVAQAQAAPEAWWQAPNATGPFTIAALTDDALDLVPNARYGSTGGARPGYRVLVGPAAANPFNLYQAGDVDIVPSTSAASLPLAADPASRIEVSIVRTPLFATSYIALGNQAPPLDDVHVRRALARLLSPRLIADSLYAGAVVAAEGLIPPDMLGRAWPVAGIGEDQDAARAEIAASRYGRGADVPPITIYAADIEPVEALRDLAARELGLTVQAVAVNPADFFSGLAARRFPAYALYWGADFPDPAAFLQMLFAADGSDNYTGYRNAEYDAILEAARRIADTGQRAARYAEAQRVLLADGAVIPLYHDVAISLVRPGIAGLAPTPMGVLGLETVTTGH